MLFRPYNNSLREKRVKPTTYRPADEAHRNASLGRRDAWRCLSVWRASQVSHPDASGPQ
jgi:hypothetical protein